MNNRIQKPVRPDKTLFFAMTGAFLLLLSIAPAYWAFYNYGEYARTKSFVEELKTKSEPFLTDAEIKEKESRIFFLGSSVERCKLQMLLSGACALVLFGVALLLLTKSFKNRNKKNFYHEIDWRTQPAPTAQIKVEYKNLHNILLLGIGAFFVSMAALIFYQTLVSRFSTTREIIVKGAFCLFLFGFVLFLVFLSIRAKRNSVKSFDASGVTRGDGRRFAWTQFCGVVTQTAKNRFGRRYVWRKELAFSGGETAWIIPQRVKNADEVFAHISHLPPAQLKSSF